MVSGSEIPNMGLLSWLSWSPRGRENGAVANQSKVGKVKETMQRGKLLDSEGGATKSCRKLATKVRARLSSKKGRALDKGARTLSIKRKQSKKSAPKNKKKDQPKNSESASDGGTSGNMPATRVKSLWKVRPLPVDEKLKIFIEGRDDDCAKYDGGDFYQWLQDCKDGKADPMEGGAYPLVIQDSDLRHLLEIKNPSNKALETINAKFDATSKPKRDHTKAAASGIQVPSWRLLESRDRPEAILRRHQIPLLVRNPGGDAVKLKKTSQKGLSEMDEEIEHAYMRYMQPTPDDFDQAIEYDLDEEDEKWLAKYNRNRSKLDEEWMEHLMDRMEKEYTLELQKHPEKWILKKEQDNESGQGHIKEGAKGMIGVLPPPLILPSISEMFPMSKCLKARGLDNLETAIVRDVYNYWKKKHQRSGRPLIQRLWYEPPWHRKASDATAKDAENEDVFAGYDVPSTLSRIRKRKMNNAEVQLRFDCMRRDLEMVRTIADLVRRREKLKKQETVLLKAEWASRMQDIASGVTISMTRGQLKSRPPKLSSLVESKKPHKHGHSITAKEQKVSLERTMSEDRAARLAARRNVRAEALASKPGLIKRTKRPALRNGEKGKQRESGKKGLKSSSSQPRSRNGQFLSYDS